MLLLWDISLSLLVNSRQEISKWVFLQPAALLNYVKIQRLKIKYSARSTLSLLLRPWPHPQIATMRPTLMQCIIQTQNSTMFHSNLASRRSSIRIVSMTSVTLHDCHLGAASLVLILHRDSLFRASPAREIVTRPEKWVNSPLFFSSRPVGRHLRAQMLVGINDTSNFRILVQGIPGNLM